jgi:hypothetical protein
MKCDVTTIGVMNNLKLTKCNSKITLNTNWFIAELKAERGFGGLGVSALAFGTQFRGFKLGRSRRIFQGEKILSAPSFGREVKPWFPCR